MERWFGEPTGKRLRRGVFVSVDDLKEAIDRDEVLKAWNTGPKPFVRTATVDSIVEKLSLPADAGEHQARLHATKSARNKGKITPAVCATLHQLEKHPCAVTTKNLSQAYCRHHLHAPKATKASPATAAYWAGSGTAVTLPSTFTPVESLK